ncbi:MAG: acyl-CoA dehydrogenase family protein [Burkholderiales bacterium]|nr:acyl-CoA dehydrogenase family protein [Burkholderiales bacterium]
MGEAINARAAERALLRDSLRGFLAHHWPAAEAPARQADAVALAAAWQGLGRQGLTALGGDPDLGGVAELMVAMQELGRAACPLPLADAFLAQRALAGAAGQAAELRDLLAAGRVCVALALGRRDGDDAAGTLSLTDGGVTGTLRFVPSGATHVLAATDDADTLVLVACDAHAVTRASTPTLGTHGYDQISMVCCKVAWALPSALPIADLARLRRLALLAHAHGAARRAFEMAVDYAKERHQFGRAIGSFQAIQHKLANCLIDLTGVELVITHAAQLADAGDATWRHFVAAGVSFGGPALRRVSLETHHTFGAIGYAEEHEAPRHFRSVHLDTLAMGGVRRARAELATRLLDETGGRLPRHDLGEAGNALRDEVGTWLAAHWSGERKAKFDARPFHDREFDAGFARAIGETGWIGLTWPREHGGQARTPIEQVAFMEEMERGEAPRIGASVQATALMLFGTPAQQHRYLPEILAGEAMHGMGYSEPQAGSDLAALKTSAVRDGGDWVINGQKIWTTTWWGKYMFLAARTDPAARPAHAGISMFIVPMDTPGIKVHPAATMYDGTFANIFYDNVRVPADALVGPENGGWKVLTSALATERGLVGGGIVLKVQHAFELFCGLVRSSALDGVPLHEDALVRERVAQIAAEIEVGRLMMMHCAQLAGSGETPPEAGAMSKVFSGELMERFGEAALEILGMRATLSQGAPGSIAHGRFEQGLRHSLMWVISIGTNEIQRSLIAQRGLGLPR